LSLTREGASWRYRISNDAPGDSETDAAGAGLDGLARRAAEAGGELEVHHDKGAFSVSISVPVESTVPR
jgi:two-component system sensor histidine kinase DesK